MSVFNKITRLALDYRARQRRLATRLKVSGLSPDILKDIGWPDPGFDEAVLTHRRRR